MVCGRRGCPGSFTETRDQRIDRDRFARQPQTNCHIAKCLGRMMSAAGQGLSFSPLFGSVKSVSAVAPIPGMTVWIEMTYTYALKRVSGG